ncbi:MAG: tetratricopeptide repeat protein [Candidatus Pacebacteria bacterium]|nr:tetratricopeptide repeat protein [Candidatus Paceibacterota bacterium]
MKFPKIRINSNILENISFSLLLVLPFLLLLIISPSNLVSFSYAKSFLLILFTVLSAIAFILHILKRGSLYYPKSWWLITMLVVPLVVLISAALSKTVGVSILGYGIEYSSFTFIFAVFTLTFLVMQTFSSPKKIFYAYIAFILGAVIIFMFHLLRFIFGVDFLSFGIFTDITSNTFGKWNDLAVIAGVSTIISALFIETTKATKELKVVAYVVFVLSAIFLVAVNFSVVWVILGILSLISFVYLFSYRGNKRTLPVLSTIILILSVIFLMAGDFLGGFIWRLLGTNVVDVQPGVSATFEILRGTFSNAKNIIFGSGPGTFIYQWQLFKPDLVNQTRLWNADFDYGFSYIMTTAITTGILGILSWIAFMVMLVYEWLKSITLTKEQTPFIKYLILSSFIVTVFLWSVMLVHVPGVVVFSLTFIFTGLFLATLVISGVIKQKELVFIKSPRIGFVTTLISVSLVICFFAIGYVSFQRVLAYIYYQKASVALSNGDSVLAGNTLVKSINLYEGDVYLQSLANLNLIQFNRIVSTEDLSSSSVVNRAQQSLGLSISNSQSAIGTNPLNYQNYVSLGDIYLSVVPLNIPGAIEGARFAYEAAIERAPKNPNLYLSLARLEMNQNNLDAARDWVNKALEKKNNFTAAIFTLAQIEISSGNVDGAISSVEVATLIEPNNPTIFFQLGILYYDKESYKDAANSFERAIDLAPDYANAKYFLGLTYYELNRVSESVDIFTYLKDTDPDNEEITFILDNLKSGLDPFHEATDPIDEELESREDLPLEESDGL